MILPDHLVLSINQWFQGWDLDLEIHGKVG